MSNIKPLVIEDARIIFRNFRGEKGKFNRNGARTFCVILDDKDEADTLYDEGWNVKTLEPRDEGDEPVSYLTVRVRFDVRPPLIYLVSESGKTRIDESMVDILDDVEIVSVDLVATPYEWSVQGDTGVAAYLKKMYVVMAEDDLDSKYNDKQDL